MVRGMLVALVCLGTAAAPARAQEDETRGAAAGRVAYLEARFDDAIAIFEGVIASSSISRADLALAHRYLAALHAAYGQNERALGHVRVAAALEPGASLPEGSSPDLQAAMARASAEAAPLEVALVVNTAADGRINVEAQVQAAPPGTLGTLSLACGDQQDETAVEGAAQVRLEGVPEGRCVAVARSPGGAAVARAAQRVQSLQVVGESPRRTWPWVVGIGAAVLAVGAAVLAGVILSRDGGDGVHIGNTHVVDW